MSGARRVREIIVSLLIIAFCVLIIFDPEKGFIIVAGILSLSLTIYGIRELIYYFTMARHMVGGKSALIIGVIAVDIGVFASTLTYLPNIYIVLYLLGIHAFSGAIDIMRSLEAKRMDAGSWRFKMASGAVNIVIAVLCVIFLNSTSMIVYIYTAGLAYSAVARIVTACRKTAIVYIQ